MPSCGTNRRSAVLTYASLLACTSSGAGCLDRNMPLLFSLSLSWIYFFFLFSKSWTPSFATKKLTKIVAIVSHR